MQKALIMLAFAAGVLIPTVEAKCTSAGSGCARASCSPTTSCSPSSTCTPGSASCSKATAKKAAVKAKAPRRIGR